MTLSDQYFDGVVKLVIDTVPSPIFLVDHDVRILECNTAGRDLLAADLRTLRHQPAGLALHCRHATDVAEGCGHGPVCPNCVIRNSVAEGLLGRHVVRHQHQMELVRAEQLVPMAVLITAAPFPYHATQLVLLVIEPLSEVTDDKSRLPISGWSQLLSQA